MRGGKFRGRKGQSRKHILVSVDDVLRNFDVEKGRLFGQRALMLILIAMRGHQIAAIRGTVDRNFALRAAAHGADFFALGRTISRGLTFLTNRTGHAGSRRLTIKPAEYREPG